VNVAVLGLWHLGSVIAACAAAAGHTVRGWDPAEATVDAMAAGRPPVAEPGLADLVRAGIEAGRLRLLRDRHAAVSSADVVWIAFDTPVDEDDRADVDYVIEQATAAFPHVMSGVLVVVSSQLPIGSVARLERAWDAVAHGRAASFASLPENLRLGKAIDVFMHPDRVVAGVRAAADRARVGALFAPITDRIEWMSVESAEMTKHAINAFLAASVTFINELAALCERTGADAREVERGLRTERRIGPSAYVSPGAAFAGGTLARDVMYLRALGERIGRATPLFDGVEASNRLHRGWALERLQASLGTVAGKTVAVWGLTYKPGTDTLRRSMAVELCLWLLDRGVRVRVHDPAVTALPDSLACVVRASTPLDAARAADALVVATEWPEYRSIDAAALAAVMPGGVVLDPNRFLPPSVSTGTRLRVLSVGRGDDVR
jgi:UDPglucose 6-dehydrogenase